MSVEELKQHVARLGLQECARIAQRTELSLMIYVSGMRGVPGDVAARLRGEPEPAPMDPLELVALLAPHPSVEAVARAVGICGSRFYAWRKGTQRVPAHLAKRLRELDPEVSRGFAKRPPLSTSMSPETVNALTARLGSRTRVAKLLGCDRKSLSRFCDGHRRISEARAKLLLDLAEIDAPSKEKSPTS